MFREGEEKMISKKRRERIYRIFFLCCLFSFFCASFIIGVWVGNNNYKNPVDLGGKISGIVGVLFFGLLLYLDWKSQSRRIKSDKEIKREAKKWIDRELKEKRR